MEQPDETIDKKLQGTWKTNDPDSVYKGTLEITFDRIIITGYGETQTPTTGGDDTQRPFRNIIKDTPLKVRSEGSKEGNIYKGSIYIEDAGEELPGIPYTYWDDKPPPNSERVEFLRFTFGDRQETLKKEKVIVMPSD
jgi:hypothetical protein